MGAQAVPVRRAPCTRSRVMRIDRWTTLDEAIALAGEWRDLITRAAGATPFQRPEWLLRWYEIWAADCVRLVTVRDDGGTLRAIVPAAAMNGRLELAGGGISDYLAPILDRESPGRVAAALDEALGGQSCLFHDVPPDAPWPARTSGGTLWRVAPASTCPAIALPSTRDAWRAGLPAGLQRNLRRYGARMAAQGARLWTVRQDADPAPVLDALFARHGERWHERSRPGIFADADVRRFHHASAPELLAAGVLRLHVLSVGDTIVGVQYVLIGEGRAFSYIAGFDPAWKHVSPGTLLMAYAIERAIDDGAAVFDLLRGAEPYKYAWGAVDRTTTSCSRA